MSYDPSTDPEFAAAMSRIDAGAQADVEDSFTEEVAARRKARENPVTDWVYNLPKNIGIGALRAGIETLDTVDDVMKSQAEGTGMAEPSLLPTPSNLFPEQMQAIKDFADRVERDDTAGDDIVQGVSQFALPFTAFLKVAGGLRGLSTVQKIGAAATAEAATAATAFDPHDARFTDLAKLGRETDTRFGELLRKASPDGSLVNQYIDYITTREGESEAEGRFKNVVDSLVGSAAIGAVIKSAATAYKGTKLWLESVTPSAGGAGVPNQKGMVAFHGTPHDFDRFDLGKIGTGEGNQTFGYGLYFAESKAVAGRYQQRLANAATGSNKPLQLAQQELETHGGNTVRAYKALTARAVNEPSPTTRSELQQAAEHLRSGQAIKRGKLMTVDIEDDAVGKMLDYDAPLGEQPELVKKLKQSPVWEELIEDWMRFSRGEGNERQMLESFTGADVYDILAGKSTEYDPSSLSSLTEQGLKAKKASKLLLELDVPGIRYLDGESREGGKGTRNIVLFDDKLVKITKKE